MSFKIISTILFVVLLTIKASSADSGVDLADKFLHTLSSLAKSVARIADILQANVCSTRLAIPPVVKPVVEKCANLESDKEYYLKTRDGGYAVIDSTKQLGFIRQVDAKEAAKFTVSKIACNLYGLCVNGFCMSRCMGCRSDTGDLQTIKFHLSNSKEPYSRWTFSAAVRNGQYHLKADDSHGYLTHKTTPNGDSQLTLSTHLSTKSTFHFVEVEQVETENQFYNVIGKYKSY